MTTSAVYDLIPNYDNTQHTQYPQGDKPEETLIQAPTQLQTSGETLTSIDLTWDMVEGYHTHFILQRWRLNTDTAWTGIAQPDELDRAYTDSADLQEGQHVGYRIAASDGTNQSDWSSEAWTYVLKTPTDETDLTKILWQADWSVLADGTSLNGATGEAYGIDQAGYANVSSVRTLNGRKSARETVGPSDFDGDGAVEYMGFVHWMNASYAPSQEGSECWFRIWFYNESGYVYDTNAGHRKTIRYGEVDSTGKGWGFGDFKTVAPDDFFSSPVNTMTYNREYYGGYPAFDSDASSIITNGKWICMETYTKQGRSDETGEVRLWLDGVPQRVINTTTMHTATGRLSRLIYINYWNAGLPKDVTQSWCAPAIAVRNSARDDVPHMATDASGFPFIGLAT